MHGMLASQSLWSSRAVHIMKLLFVLSACVVVACVGGVYVPTPVYSTFRSQDELGGYHFGYSGGPTSRAEHRDHNGVVRGAYNWVGGDGTVHKYEYISDANGFRLVSGTGLPVAPVHVYELPVAPVVPTVRAAPVFNLVAPQPVEETEEVKQARAKFEYLFKKAADAAAAAPDV
ncbi:cuticle protein 6 [Hyalella azteca]|uniref:Cuticle protein 6 n=1 Tax=Hyalella azteca TaxID=294128 RepID=A0A8B7P1D3_HYAAZ|nr:cuticle protein 6 [Hyalella azteca]